jgi:dTMP kinase
MPARGKFIVFEGIDGSGKRTQLELLARVLAARGIPYERLSFPRYEGFFGKLVARYLNGEFGILEAVDAHFSALLYAGDRLEAKPAIEAALAAGKTLLADRYIASNLGHQGARVPRELRDEFLRWITTLEYDVYALPTEDIVIYLRVPADTAHRQVAEKGARDYTSQVRDIQEANLAHLAAAAEVYDSLARGAKWVTIECYDAARGALRPAEEIHRAVLGAIDARIFASRTAS